VLACWSASGIVFGFAALKPVLVEEGVYHGHCTPTLGGRAQTYSLCGGVFVRWCSRPRFCDRDGVARLSLVQHVSAIDGIDRELEPDLVEDYDFAPIRRKISCGGEVGLVVAKTWFFPPSR
jgi:hypothetical protein